MWWWRDGRQRLVLRVAEVLWLLLLLLRRRLLLRDDLVVQLVVELRVQRRLLAEVVLLLLDERAGGGIVMLGRLSSAVKMRHRKGRGRAGCGGDAADPDVADQMQTIPCGACPQQSKTRAREGRENQGGTPPGTANLFV